jgi:membrane protein DedA with SNARE-associated domain
VEGESLVAHVENFLISHPVALLAVTIILEQAGVPIASAPLLLLIGALAASEGLNAPLALFVAVSACLLIDCAWFDLARIRKSTRKRARMARHAEVLKPFRIPDIFARHGTTAMFVARLLPGPNLAAAIAGYSNVSRVRFMVQDTVASAVWATLYLAAGYFLPQHLRSYLCSFASTSPGCVILLTLGLTAAVLGAFRFRRHLAKRRARRLVKLPPITSGPIVSGACLDSEVD